MMRRVRRIRLISAPAKPRMPLLLPGPFLDKSKINYDFYKTFDLNGNFKIASLTYKNEDFRNAALNGVLKDGVLTLGNFAAVTTPDRFRAMPNSVWSMCLYLKGELNLQGQKMAEKSWSGSVYGIKSGILSAQASFHTGAASEEEMLTGLGADISYTVEAPVVKGWNLSVVDADLKKRDRSDGAGGAGTGESAKRRNGLCACCRQS